MIHLTRVVINALAYKPHSSGIGVLIRELFGRFSMLCDCPCTVILSKDSPDFPDGRPQVTRYRAQYRESQKLKRIFFQIFQMGPLFCKDSVLLITDSKVPLILPRSCQIVALVTDLAVYRMPETYQASRALLWKLQYWYLRKRRCHFLAISEYTKSDIAHFFQIKPEKIGVVPCAANSQMRRVEDSAVLTGLKQKYQLPNDYILFVGNFNPRKNLERLLCAFDRFKSSFSMPHKLAIAGEYGWKFSNAKALGAMEHRDDVLFLGFVPDDDMAALYSSASLFAFVTLYEGFGIPVLEAQQCGTPVLTSNCSALPEVGGEGACYVDPYDTEKIAAGMYEILKDPLYAASLREKGYQNASRFTWESSAGTLSEILKEL